MNSTSYFCINVCTDAGLGKIYASVRSKSKEQELIKLAALKKSLEGKGILVGLVKTCKRPDPEKRYSKFSYRHIVKGSLVIQHLTSTEKIKLHE